MHVHVTIISYASEFNEMNESLSTINFIFKLYFALLCLDCIAHLRAAVYSCYRTSTSIHVGRSLLMEDN